MGERRYPPLTPAEVVAILRALGFTLLRQVGSHAQWERPSSAGRLRALVTVDMSVRDFWPELIKSMIRQAGSTREEFYGATKATARKIGRK